MDNRLTDLLTRLLSCGSYEECWKLFLAEMQALGFVHGLYGYAMASGEKDNFVYLSATDYSDDFMSDYAECEGEKYDFSLIWCLQRDDVLKWDSKKYYPSLPREAQIVEEMSYDHQIFNGLSIPLKEHGNGNWGGIGLSATGVGDKEFDRDIYPQLSYIHQAAMLFHTAAQRFSKYDLFVESELFGLTPLKPSEKETLKWLASGLSLQEIADTKVFRSIDTLNGYVRSIKKKLNARNQPQMVVTAVLLGII